MMTPAALLTRVGRVDSHIPPASFFRFAGQFAEKLRPRGIMNALSQTMITRHALDMQIFDADDSMGINDLAALLMGEVVPSERYAFMDPSHGFAVFPSLSRPFHQFGMFPIHFGQGFLFLAEKTWVFYFCPIREGSKHLESYIYPYLLRAFRKPFGVTFNRKGSRPLARRGTADGERLDLATNGPMQDDLEVSNPRSIQLALLVQLEPRLWVGEAVIAVLPLETWEARFLFMGFDSAKEGFHGKIKPYGYVLQDLRMDSGQGGTFLFQYRKGSDLPIATEAFTFLLIGILTISKQVIIEPTTLFQGFVEPVFLFLGWIYPIRKRFMHRYILAQTQQEVKRETAPHLPQERNGALIPCLKDRGVPAPVNITWLHQYEQIPTQDSIKSLS